MGAIDVFAQVAGMPLPDAAGRLAAEGLPVFPCVPGGKRPLVEHGFHEATADADQVAAWWQRWPAANIGIPTGAASGVEVVDVDVHTAGTGFPAFRAAHREGLTRRGGRRWCVPRQVACMPTTRPIPAGRNRRGRRRGRMWTSGVPAATSSPRRR